MTCSTIMAVRAQFENSNEYVSSRTTHLLDPAPATELFFLHHDERRRRGKKETGNWSGQVEENADKEIKGLASFRH